MFASASETIGWLTGQPRPLIRRLRLATVERFTQVTSTADAAVSPATLYVPSVVKLRPGGAQTVGLDWSMPKCLFARNKYRYSSTDVPSLKGAKAHSSTR